MAIVAFSVESRAAANHSGRFDLMHERSHFQAAERHQFEYAFRRFELRSVCFTSSKWPVRFQRSVDATDASLSDAELQAVSYTAAPSTFAKSFTGDFTGVRNENNSTAFWIVDQSAGRWMRAAVATAFFRH